MNVCEIRTIFVQEKMLQNPKVLQTTAPQTLHKPTPTRPPAPVQHLPTSLSPPILKQCFKLSRRELAICAKSSVLLLLGSQTIDPFHLSNAIAEENLLTADGIVEQEESATQSTTTTIDGETTIETTEQEESPTETTTTTTTNGKTAIETAEQENPTESTTITDGEATVETVEQNEKPPEKKIPTKRAFLDVSISGCLLEELSLS